MVLTLILQACFAVTALRDIDVVVTTADGKAFAATAEFATFEMEATFGNIVINLSNTKNVIFGRRDVVIVDDGTVLTGRIKLDEWNFLMGEKHVTFAKDELACISVGAAKPAMTMKPTPRLESLRCQATLAGEKGTVDGQLEPITFKVKTHFGEASIDMSRVESITFGEKDVIHLDDGTILKGRCDLLTLKLHTPAGTVSLKREELARITILRPA